MVWFGTATTSTSQPVNEEALAQLRLDVASLRLELGTMEYRATRAEADAAAVVELLIEHLGIEEARRQLVDHIGIDRTNALVSRVYDDEKPLLLPTIRLRYSHVDRYDDPALAAEREAYIRQKPEKERAVTEAKTRYDKMQAENNERGYTSNQNGNRVRMPAPYDSEQLSSARLDLTEANTELSRLERAIARLDRQMREPVWRVHGMTSDGKKVLVIITETQKRVVERTLPETELVVTGRSRTELGVFDIVIEATKVDVVNP